MEASDSFRRRLVPAIVRYLGAVASVAAALSITWLLGSYSEPSFTPLFFCAIVLTAWYAGMGPGLLSSLLASAALEYFFIPPLYSLDLGVDKVPRVITFALPALFVSWFSSQKKRTEELLRHARDELERQVEQRTADLRRTNQELQSEVAERMRAEEKLRRSEAYLAESQRQSHTGSWAWNVATGDSFWSRETYRIFGLDPATTVPHRDWVRQLRHPEDRASVAQVVEVAIREKRDLETDFRIVRPDGSIRHVHTLGHPLINESGELVEFVGTIMDITERRQAEEELRQTQAELARVARATTMGELAASIAHEVNQPLAAVVANANACLRWLAREAPELDEARAAAERIVRDGNRAGEVIARIRTLLKKGPPARKRLDLNHVVGEIIDLTRGEVRRHHASLQADLADGLPPVRADRVQLQQVLLNLVVNALDAMNAVAGRPRLLRILTERRPPGEVVVAVEDTGVGLEAQQMEHLFQAFYTTKPQGLGMGLSISRSIIEAHGGRIWAAPNDGPGATFHFTLPTEEEGEE